MPVNYERAPWDKENPLAVRIVNQILSEHQRKAAFIDSFLHAPREIIFYSGTGGYLALFIVHHPVYPVCTGMISDTNLLDGPLGEKTLTYSSAIHNLFNWDTTREYEMYWRDTDANLEMFNRYFKGQYQDSQSRDTLFSPVGVVDSWQTTGVYTQYLQCMCLHNDAAVGTRPESLWNLDTLWTNKKFIFGRSYERMPEDSNLYHAPPPEADNQDEEVSKSEAYFPRLPGFHVDYIDSLGIFTPNNFNANAIVSGYFEEFLYEKNAPSDILDIFQRSVILERGIVANNLRDIQNANYWKMSSQLVGAVPIIGGMLGTFNSQAATAYTLADKFKFWPRLYAFGRQYQPAPTPAEMSRLYNWYRKTNNNGEYPDIYEMDQVKFGQLVDLLLEREYIKESDVYGWI